ncbi:hypothetical protein JR338_00960 [Chloroflexota bacterium]|nr:hypothetical protein JR338_00960 [Chloroflexota bacterium]
MISLSVLFWIFVVLFAIIGAMRGWAKEILVTSGVIVAIFVITILETFIPGVRDNVNPNSQFWLRIGILAGLTFFGYQGPNIPRLIDSGKFIRDRFQDVLLGIFLGAVNGYMIFGTAWYYLDFAGYPFKWITAPDQVTEAGLKAASLLKTLPPVWLQSPVIYIAVAISFIFILVVFI